MSGKVLISGATGIAGGAAGKVLRKEQPHEQH
jgi:hypothetical protein